MGVTAEPRPAPGSLDLIRLLLNTTDLEDGTDELDTAAGTRAWLVEHDLLRRNGNVDERGRQRIVELREGLRALAYTNNHGPSAEDDLMRLNRRAAETSLTPVFAGGEDFGLMGSRRDVSGATASLLAIVCEAMRDGTWSRLKACRNSRCRWAFYDSSRNRTGNWCSMAICGNRAKTRAYRQRQRATAS
jgi:predicted RNA-binding Zn ribbon-like protein